MFRPGIMGSVLDQHVVDSGDLQIMLGELAEKHPEAHKFIFVRLGELKKEQRAREAAAEKQISADLAALGTPITPIHGG